MATMHNNLPVNHHNKLLPLDAQGKYIEEKDKLQPNISQKPTQVDQQEVDITFKDIKYIVKTKQGPKQLLRGVDGYCKAGEVTAILGSSGAGKTTLLNILSKRIQNGSNGVLSGSIQANGHEYSEDEFSSFGAYVMQDDVLLETMTVKETFEFAANLKTKGTPQQKEEKVIRMIKSLQLERCQNTFIGGLFVKGISGGEKKRVSIGYEMISDPACLFLDEPTSGLDSFTAFSIIHLLKEFAQTKRKTVAFTIHQPSSDIWHLFDKIMLMVEGRFIYQGTGGKQVVDHFATIGFSCPIKSNPGDYLMKIMHAGSEQNVKNYPIYFGGYDSKLKQTVDKSIESAHQGTLPAKSETTSFFYQTIQLAARQVKIIKRNPILSKARLGQSVIMSLFLGIIYLQLPKPEDHPSFREINNKTGFLFFYCIAMLMMTLNPCILTFPSQRAVFLREENARLYTVSSYFLGKFLIDMISSIIFPTISSLIVYWMVGLNTDNSGKFAFFWFIIILQSCIGLGLGYLGGSIFSDAKVAISVTPLMNLPFMLFSGFFKNASDYASWIGWVQYISPFKYSLIALARNEYEYEGLSYTPDPIERLNFNMEKWESTWCLLGLFGFFTIFAYLFFATLKKRLQ